MCGAFIFLADGENDEQRLSYGELDLRARAIAGRLQGYGMAGERVLLLLPPGLEYLAAFFGCLYAAAVAVPAYPPRGRRGLPRLTAVLEDCEPAGVLTVAALRPIVEHHLASTRFRDLPCLDVDELAAAAPEAWREPVLDAETLAFLQYTSGSTSAPKGVTISHGNLIVNQAMIGETFATTEDSVVVSWLPLYHDMGLIGGLLHPIYRGARCVLLSPLHFLQRPARWLEAISRYRATVSGGPNFAYDLCARKVDLGKTPDLDLSSWQVAFNGAEPVRRETLERFAAAFADVGFRRRAFFPCYGLAEATLMVAGGRYHDQAEQTEAQPVSCGVFPQGLEVRVVDPGTRIESPSATVGEIWVAGASVARGYWQRPRESAETFGAYLADGGGPFLRTGDLGAVRAGELYVVGRIKDLIIIRGRNLYPQDIEWTVEKCHPLARAGGAAAFAVEIDGEERLVIVQEVATRRSDRLPELAAAIREAVAGEHEVQVASLVLVEPGGVPKTTSGKVRRRACRDLLLTRRLPTVAEWQEGDVAAGRHGVAPRTPTEERIARLWEEVLDLAAGTVGVEDSFFALGGDSLRGSQLLVRLREATGAELSLEELFAAPTVAALAERAAASTAGEGQGTPLARVDRSRLLPLSSAQRRLWFLDQLEPGNPAYNLAVSLHLSGPLDTAALAAALTEIVRRHEALRTVFRVQEAMPVQVPTPSPEAGLPLPRIDLSRLASPAPVAAELARRGAGRPFDLAAGPVIRAQLVRLAAAEHQLHVTLHHIVSDAWSVGVLLHEISVLYPTFSLHRPSPLPELPVQYADYSCWQRQRLSGEAAQAQLAAWRRRLAGRPPVLELPADRPRPPARSYRGAHATRVLQPVLEQGLRSLASAGQASLFMTLLAGFQALLHRLTAQRDLVVGTAVANRDHSALEGLIGFFVNTLPLRTEVSGDVTFAELLRRARSTVLEAFAGREVPFERLVDELETRRDLSRTPIVQVMLVLQNAPFEMASPPGLALTALEVDNGTARFDLAVSLIRGAYGLAAVFKYSRDLFDATTVERLARQFEEVLTAGEAAPGRRLGELPLLGRAERHQVVTEWNATALPGLEAGCLHELFEAQVDRTPEATAVVFEDRALTYAELDRRANRLARRLRRSAVGPETLVGVALERSLELVVALYGVLKAGGAYLPLDPSYPAERLAFMVEDARAAVVLSPERLRAELAAGRAESVDRLGVRVRSENLAYAIYTSGSTGWPKGSMIPHRGIVNRLRWMQRAYGLVPGEGVLQKTPASFDVSVWEFFWPLVVGARLVLARPGEHQDPARLVERIARQAVTTLHFVPSMLQVFLDEPRLRADRDTPTASTSRVTRSLRRVIVSGEALPRELEQRFVALVDAELHNLYGPTEASVDVTAWACGREANAAGVPIGRPISNLRIHLTDRGGLPVPVGVAGHLHIGGLGLARGYLSRAGLTAERFVPDPFAGPGDRLYATGDLARLRVDGAIQFLGRLDHQVKIRGRRIELGEIEAALNVHPAVRESVVVAAGGDVGDRRLVAYLVGHRDGAPAAAELRGFLAERLPDYMVPTFFVVLEALPLSPSGKVDRQALPAPEAELRAVAAPKVAPRTALERRLAAMWREQLRIAEVGVDDDFFELGGDSILGALLINRLQRELQAIVYVMALFDAPTVARFAAYLEGSYRPALVAAGWLTADADADGREEHAAGDADEAVELASFSRYLVTRFTAAETGDEAGGPKNRRAIFVLSPFRSGSTLLRVMLDGHSRLFAPPELELLGFATLGERRRLLSGRDSFSREGMLRAVMELLGCDTDTAAALVAEAEQRDEPTRDFYRRIQEWAGERILVDKTPRYALDLATLRRAESYFEQPFYIHLVRHPGGTVHSYLEARMQDVYRFPLPASRQAELVWRRSHENILEHLAAVPAGRQHRLHFEDLVRDPRGAMARLCRALSLELEAAMLSPYEGERMTDGLHRAGRMMGDPKFHQHRRIEADVAQRWRESSEPIRLGDATRRLAERLGISSSTAAPAASPAASAIGPRPLPRSGVDEGGLPLSFAQERLWFLDRLELGGSAYSMPAAVRLTGRLDVAALERTCAELERRHEVLRTVFPTVGGRPRQQIREASGWRLSRIDLGALAAPARQAEVARRIDEEARRRFDLAAGALWRVRLLRLAEDEHVLLVNLHHIICDGWSIGILTREMAALYGAFRHGLASPLPAPALHYADFAAWQRGHLSGQVLEEHLRYWRERLAGAPPVLQLPTDRPRPTVQTHRGEHLAVRLAPPLTQELKGLGRQAGATLFMVLVAVFQALLRRYCGQDDVVIGTPVANRNCAEVEELIGLFVNSLVLRTDLSGEPDLGTLLGRVRQVCVGASRHEELPFEKLVDELGVERSLGHSPLFVVMLSLQNAPPASLILPGLALERLDVHTHTAKLDLTLDLTERPDGELSGSLEYNVDLFDATSAARLARHFKTLVSEFAATLGVGNPISEVRLSSLSLLTSPERHQLVTGVNDTESPFPRQATVHELFETRARRAPEAVAVSFQGREVRYGELAASAERLARRLTGWGVGPEVRVGICVERTPDLLAALLAVLKAGGGYVPLDPLHPGERLAYILTDAGIRLLLTERSLLATLPAHPARVVLLDEALATGQEQETPAPETRVPLRPARPENLAYVIYTSGSTGGPKGVEISHRAVVNYLTTMARRPGLAAGDGMVALTTLSFDIAVTELLLPLAVGARIELLSQRTATDAVRLSAAVDAAEVTCIQATPATWTLLLEGGWQGREGLKALCGGEALPRPLADRLLERVGSLWNVYGPTETTVWSTHHPLARGERQVSIGRPLGNTTVYLLGRDGEVVPQAVVGELTIGGSGLARGYGGRPGLTADRFVPDPFGVAGSRLYRTGDLARRLADGSLECLGRRDHQVKLRGFRIEIGEIEAALLGHPAVRQCVVAMSGERAADLRLVAYVVKARGIEVSWNELRGFLGDKLPAPMVPSAVVFHDRFSLQPSGKVDRRSLPDPDRRRPELTGSFVPPGDDEERLVAEVWQEVLRLDRVGVEDNFFDLGGNSLLAAEVHGKLRERFPAELSLIDLFQHPTVRALAGRLRGRELQAHDLAHLTVEVAKQQRVSQLRRRALARQRGNL